MEIRNIAIIAHVDHGKTTLTDAILSQTGAVDTGISMDSNTLEKERGITIYSKNAAVTYKGTKINIVDTPGHADFGSEVERVLRSIDSVLLIVDAQEGPMPQTRFVLKKSLALGLKPILVINKIDKPAANPAHAHDQVFELFAELGATNEQLDFPVIYAIGREGIAKKELTDESKDLTPLLDMILEKVPAAKVDIDAPFLAQPFNLAYDNFLGRVAVVRVYSGKINVGDTVYIQKDGSINKYKVTKLFAFKGVTRVEIDTLEAGDIGMIAGIPDVYIGDTIAGSPETPVLDIIAVDEPTIELTFLVNNSPFAGREGKFVTSRQIRERLEKELEVNVGLKVNFDSASGDQFTVYGRGELHVAILLENMRREGYEVQVSQPQVITKEIDGKLHEPFEEIVIDVPSDCQGSIIEKLSKRGSILKNMEIHENRALLLFEGPSRGLFGYRNKFIIDTKGEGIMATRNIGYKPHVGEIERHDAGSMISQVSGKTLAYSLDNLQTRGVLYIKENTEVYEGMVIGNTSKGEQMTVNPTKGKQLTNMRASGSDDAVKLVPPQLLTIENGLEIMAKDEYLEITPQSVRLRKKNLKETERNKSNRK
ncbi:MAG: translational GTPase TypA [Parcubacteria group bacterium CG10_big_fil_rev_8_21_14_0_10_38_31]|nr:MAG: translational GTPase TypA [Parcubacteria group bacterium CG10_big_fil_rev_8_21_14_0_10_38_31]